jgi:hypothetical protein
MVKIYPETILKKSLPNNFFEQNLLTKDFSLKKKAMQALILATTATKREINASVLKVADIYQSKIDDLTDEGLPKAKATVIAKAGESLLKQRIAGLVIFDAVEVIKKNNEGEKYRWLASSSENPDPQHQLLYGKIFNVGEGDQEGNMPMERFGCNCGIEILSNKKNS